MGPLLNSWSGDPGRDRFLTGNAVRAAEVGTTVDRTRCEAGSVPFQIGGSATSPDSLSTARGLRSPPARVVRLCACGRGHLSCSFAVRADTCRDRAPLARTDGLSAINRPCRDPVLRSANPAARDPARSRVARPCSMRAPRSARGDRGRYSGLRALAVRGPLQTAPSGPWSGSIRPWVGAPAHRPRKGRDPALLKNGISSWPSVILDIYGGTLLEAAESLIADPERSSQSRQLVIVEPSLAYCSQTLFCGVAVRPRIGDSPIQGEGGTT